MYKKTIRALEDRFWDQHSPAGYHNQLRTKTQEDGELLQEFTTATEQSTHCASAALHEGHVCRGLGRSSIRIRKMNDGGGPVPNEKVTTDSLRAGTVGALAT
jgi:hypothetical protein